MATNIQIYVLQLLPFVLPPAHRSTTGPPDQQSPSAVVADADVIDAGAPKALPETSAFAEMSERRQ